ncbi:MAG: hypothetical protein ACRDO4_10105 [Nocardioides sp.]
MSAPILILAPPRSGASVVAGLLIRSAGLLTAELLPATEDRPMGTFESYGVVDAHRDLLAQVERDWTCPPAGFDPGALDLSALTEQIRIHSELDGPWLVKESSLTFLLPAWAAAGINRVRLVAVIRPPGDTIRSLMQHEGLPELHAEALVEAHLARLAAIAEQVSLPVVQFPAGNEGPVSQVRSVAAALGLPWNSAGEAIFAKNLVRQRSRLQDPGPVYTRLLHEARLPSALPEVDLSLLSAAPEHPWPLPTHHGPQEAQRSRQLWRLADFSAFQAPRVVELMLAGAAPTAGAPPGIELHRISASEPQDVGAALVESEILPHGVIAPGVLAGLKMEEVELLLRTLHSGTRPLARLVIDVPSIVGSLGRVTPAPVESPTQVQVEAAAAETGWNLQRSERLSPGRVGLVLHKNPEPASAPTAALAADVEELRARVAAMEAKIDSPRWGRRWRN